MCVTARSRRCRGVTRNGRRTVLAAATGRRRGTPPHQPAGRRRSAGPLVVRSAAVHSCRSDGWLSESRTRSSCGPARHRRRAEGWRALSDGSCAQRRTPGRQCRTLCRQREDAWPATPDTVPASVGHPAVNTGHPCRQRRRPCRQRRRPCRQCRTPLPTTSDAPADNVGHPCRQGRRPCRQRRTPCRQRRTPGRQPRTTPPPRTDRLILCSTFDGLRAVDSYTRRDEEPTGGDAQTGTA